MLMNLTDRDSCAPLQLLGSHFGRPCCELRSSGRVCLITGDTSGLSGARGVMVIVVGNGHGNTSSNPRRD